MTKSIKSLSAATDLLCFFAQWSQNVLTSRTLGLGYNTRNFVKT